MLASKRQRGQILKDARIQRGLTQGELAREVGYSSPQYVSNWERGLCDVAFDKLPRVCDLLQIPKEILIESYTREKEEELETIFHDARD